MLAEHFFYSDFCLCRRADILDRNHLLLVGTFYTGYAMLQLYNAVCAAGAVEAQQTQQTLRCKIDFTPSPIKQSKMLTSNPCSICSETGHSSSKCPELSSETKHPDAPQPSGPRGQGEDDD